MTTVGFIGIALCAIAKLFGLLYGRSLASGYHWLAMETAELLSRLKPSSNYNQLAPALREDSEIQTIVDLIRPQEAWEMCLNALANLQSRPQTSLKPESELRLAWFITEWH